MFQIKPTNNTGRLEGTHSEEKHRIFVQEIMFEKYWNEIQSLSGITNPQLLNCSLLYCKFSLR